MKKLILSTLAIASLVGCSSGGNGGGSPSTPTTPSYTHNELAEIFVNKLNLSADFDVTLVKNSTLVSDFIVIYDPLYDSYDAIDIYNYNPAYDNAESFYNDNLNQFYTDLDVLPSHYEIETRYEIIGYDYDGYAIWGYQPYTVWVPTRYRDRSSGVVFEKQTATPKDLAKVSAIKEIAAVEKTAQFLSSEFGLSLNRGKEVARLATHWKKASKKGMTDLEQDNFATELLGFSITKGIESVKTGDTSSINNLIETAAKTNDITPEHAQKLLTKILSL